MYLNTYTQRAIVSETIGDLKKCLKCISFRFETNLVRTKITAIFSTRVESKIEQINCKFVKVQETRLRVDYTRVIPYLREGRETKRTSRAAKTSRSHMNGQLK